MNVLSTIPGEILGASHVLTARARDCAQQTRLVVVRLPDGKRAQVTFVKLGSKKGKTVRWVWTPARAELLGG